MVRSDDALEILWPGADAAALRRAREVTQFLRLLCDDARRSHAPAVGIDIERARGVYDDHGRAAVEQALTDLLRHHLRAIAHADSFLCAGDPAAELAPAWREVEQARDDFAELPELPRPGESAVECGRRILNALEGVADATAAQLWRARWIHATEGPRAAERAHRELLAASRRPSAPAAVQRAAIAGIAECLLERGAAREARAWLGEHAREIAVDPRLRVLCAWTRLALEDVAGARAALTGVRPWSGPIPSLLVELREVQPDWLACLAGRVDAAPVTASHAELRERGDAGASALVVLAFRPGEGTQPVVFDAAPALSRRREEWLHEREGASAVAGEREHVLVARAVPMVEHAAPGTALRGVLGGAATRAVALAPILDEEGDAAGWVHLEFEHHLVPSRARLAACAARWRRTVLQASSADADQDPRRSPPRRAVRSFASVFPALVADLGMKTVLRRWSGFSVEDGEPVLVAEGGEGQGFATSAPGRARALARALATGGRIEFEGPDDRLAVHAGAASGVVLPLRFEGATRGLLAVESSRRRDFQGVDLDVWSRRADASAVALRTAQFQAWHRERFGFEPWFDARRPDFQLFARRLAQAARARAAVLVQGPAGAGKLVMARWLHFESSLRAGPFVVFTCGLPAGRVDWTRLAQRAACGTLVLDGVEALDPALQEDLLAHFEGDDRTVEPPVAEAFRVVGTTRSEWGPGARGGSLRPDLASRLDRLRLSVPSLSARREEIPALAEALAARFAEEEGLAPPRFSDDALALLWRQPWPGNVREIENLVYKLVLAQAGAQLGAADVVAVAQESGLALARRLPSRHPDRRDLLAALRTTRTAGSRANKTRAAIYLGWDPDTLVARLVEAGLTDEVLDTTAWDGAERSPEMPEA